MFLFLSMVDQVMASTIPYLLGVAESEESGTMSG